MLSTFASMRLTAALPGIPVVIRRRAVVEVRRIAADWIIAAGAFVAGQTASTERTVSQFIGDPVRRVAASIGAMADHAMPKFVTFAHPRPAGIRTAALINQCPETVGKGAGISSVFARTTAIAKRGRTFLRVAGLETCAAMLTQARSTRAGRGTVGDGDTMTRLTTRGVPIGFGSIAEKRLQRFLSVATDAALDGQGDSGYSGHTKTPLMSCGHASGCYQQRGGFVMPNYSINPHSCLLDGRAV